MRKQSTKTEILGLNVFSGTQKKKQFFPVFQFSIFNEVHKMGLPYFCNFLQNIFTIYIIAHSNL